MEAKHFQNFLNNPRMYIVVHFAVRLVYLGINYSERKDKTLACMSMPFSFKVIVTDP